MRRVAATVALLILAVPAVAGVAAWSGCALPEPPRCCCPANDHGCSCGCGAGRTPARAPEPLAPPPQAPEQGLTALPAVAATPASDEAGQFVAALHPQVLPSASDLVIAICTFRC